MLAPPPLITVADDDDVDMTERQRIFLNECKLILLVQAEAKN